MRYIILVLLFMGVLEAGSSGGLAQINSSYILHKKYPERRVALLISNFDYKYMTHLGNTKQDVKLLAKALKRIGFIVHIKYNLNKKMMRKAIGNFKEELKKYENPISFFYYSGHGMQNKNINYMMPIDMKSNERNSYINFNYNAIKMDEIIKSLNNSFNKANMLFFDACRTEIQTRGIGTLKQVKLGGTLVVFSTQAGELASDTNMFIKELTSLINTKDKSILDIGNDLSSFISIKTNHQQVPMVLAQSLPHIILNPSSKEKKVQIKKRKQKKKALLIGNKDYEKRPLRLKNPIRDIKSVELALRNIGFKTILLKNATKGETQIGLDNFYHRAKKSDIALIYFSGHGLQILDKDTQKVQNYLLPIEANIQTVRDLRGLIKLETLIEDSSYAKKSIVLIDACRDNPLYEKIRQLLQREKTKSTTTTKGLGHVTTHKRDILIGFATQSNQVSMDDGYGQLSPYAKALSNNLGKSLDIRILLGKVRDEVLKITKNQQEPELIDKLGGERVCLTGVCK